MTRSLPRATSTSARHRRVTLTATAALALAALGLTLAPKAAAGTYRAAQCHSELGAGRGAAAFSRTSSRYRGTADCSGRGLAITHEPGHERTPGGRSGSWTIAAPAGAAIVGAAAAVSAAGADWHAPQLLLGLADGARRAIAGVRGERHRVGWRGASGRALIARLGCTHRRSCGAGRGAHVHLRRIMLTLRDVAEPGVEPGGALLAPGSRRGFQLLRIDAADSGGGVRAITVELNDEPLLVRRLDCAVAGRTALRLRPCPRSAASTFDLATTSDHFRQGPNRLRVCAIDFGPRGSANRGCAARRVRVDNLCPISERAGTELQARFRGDGSRLATRSDRPVAVTGRVLGRSGAAVPGATVCVAARVRGSGASERVIATPRTDARGFFRARLAQGPNREIRVAHWADADHAHERYLRIKARAIPRLRLRPTDTLRNGERVRFAVGLPGPAGARRRVAVEARSSHGWVRVAAGRTSMSGRWHGAYRFRSTTGIRRYAFRAIVPKQPGYPYAAGRSAIRRVTVRG